MLGREPETLEPQVDGSVLDCVCVWPGKKEMPCHDGLLMHAGSATKVRKIMGFLVFVPARRKDIPDDNAQPLFPNTVTRIQEQKEPPR